MIFKRIDNIYPYASGFSKSLVKTAASVPDALLIDKKFRNDLVKYDYLPDDVRDYINQLTKLPEYNPDKFAYLLQYAVAALEYWGPNNNGDAFEEYWLIKKHYTFVENAKYFRQHKNKHGADKDYGKPVFSTYDNKSMKRVVLVVAADKESAKDIIADVEKGHPRPVSMGAGVKFDICSICGHKSETRAEYCDHLKFHMGEVLEDGKQIYALNPDPVFFDISDVVIGADPTAYSVEKVAHLRNYLDKEAAKKVSVPVIKSIKKADIVKELPPDVDKVSGYIIDILKNYANSINSGEKIIPPSIFSQPTGLITTLERDMDVPLTFPEFVSCLSAEKEILPYNLNERLAELLEELGGIPSFPAHLTKETLGRVLMEGEPHSDEGVVLYNPE